MAANTDKDRWKIVKPQLAMTPNGPVRSPPKKCEGCGVPNERDPRHINWEIPESKFCDVCIGDMRRSGRIRVGGVFVFKPRITKQQAEGILAFLEPALESPPALHEFDCFNGKPDWYIP